MRALAASFPSEGCNDEEVSLLATATVGTARRRIEAIRAKRAGSRTRSFIALVDLSSVLSRFGWKQRRPAREVAGLAAAVGRDFTSTCSPSQ